MLMRYPRIIVYFMVGLSHEAARLFKFLLILVEYCLGMTLFVRSTYFVSALASSATAASRSSAARFAISSS